MVDVGQLVGAPELRPGHSVRAVVDERGVRDAREDHAVLEVAVALVLAAAVRDPVVEVDAPAAAEQASGPLDQRLEVGPRLRGERLDLEVDRRVRHGASLGVVPDETGPVLALDQN